MSLSRSRSRGGGGVGGGGEGESEGRGIGTGSGKGAPHVAYEAESPDEAAFVETARQLGFELMERKQNSVRVRELVGVEAAAGTDAEAGEGGEEEAKYEDR